MMCDPCFMDANQVGYVHELAWDEITEDPRRRADDQAAPPDERAVLGRRADALAALPRRHPLRAQDAATSPCSARPTACASPQEPGFAKQAKEAGLRMAYLQFDGVGNEANAHRKVGNLFDVKLRAIEELHAAGIDVDPGRHRRQRRQQRPGRPDRRSSRSTTPTRSRSSRSSRCQLHRPRRGHRRRARATQQRYTLIHLAHDVKAQTGVTEPMRDWFPLSALGPFSDLVDHLDGRARRLGRDEVRLPPQLRHRHRALGEQEDEADGAAHAVPRHGGAARGHRHHHRRRAAASRSRWRSWRWRCAKNYRRRAGAAGLQLRRRC